MIVIKENVELIINDDQLEQYCKAGFKQLGNNPICDSKELKDFTVSELKKIAEESGIDGYASLTKAELIKVLGG